MRNSTPVPALRVTTGVNDQGGTPVRNWRTVAGAAALSVLVGASLLVPMTGVAQTGTTQLSDVLAQLRRNAKVSERLNAAFFRAPQTRAFAGSSFNPVDSDLAFSANFGDGSLKLNPTRQTVSEQNGTVTVQNTDQTTGTFETALDVPNRAQVLEVTRSYKDVAGNNTTTNGQQAPSGYLFQIIEVSQTGTDSKVLFEARSTDGKTGSDTTTLPNGGFRVDNSRKRYILRVRIDETNADSRFYGITLQEVIGKGVPGAPTS
jgi:hypothetical protein